MSKVLPNRPTAQFGWSWMWNWKLFYENAQTTIIKSCPTPTHTHFQIQDANQIVGKLLKFQWTMNANNGVVWWCSGGYFAVLAQNLNLLPYLTPPSTAETERAAREYNKAPFRYSTCPYVCLSVVGATFGVQMYASLELVLLKFLLPYLKNN